MDYYLNTENSFDRLWKEYTDFGSLVVAFDLMILFSTIIIKVEVILNILTPIKELKMIGCYLNCWTGQENLDFIRQYLLENDIPYDSN